MKDYLLLKLFYYLLSLTKINYLSIFTDKTTYKPQTYLFTYNIFHFISSKYLFKIFTLNFISLQAQESKLTLNCKREWRSLYKLVIEALGSKSSTKLNNKVLKLLLTLTNHKGALTVFFGTIKIYLTTGNILLKLCHVSVDSSKLTNNFSHFYCRM